MMKLLYVEPEIELLAFEPAGVVCQSVLENPETGGEYEW